MRYHEDLTQGFPIASGVIEGVCRHVVKDHLEPTGMSWGRQGAQSKASLDATFADNNNGFLSHLGETVRR